MSDAEVRGSADGVSPEVKASLLWGVVGGLTFLVLAQGYELLGNEPIPVGVKVGVAVVVAAVTVASTYAMRGRLPTENESS